MLDGIRDFFMGKEVRPNDPVQGENKKLGHLEISGRADTKVKIINKDTSASKLTGEIRNLYNNVVNETKGGVASEDLKKYNKSSKEVVRYMNTLYESKSLPTRIFLRLTGFKQLRDDFANLKFEERRGLGPDQIELSDNEVVQNDKEEESSISIDLDDDDDETAPELSIAIPEGERSSKEQFDSIENRAKRNIVIKPTDDSNKIVYPDTNVDLDADFSKENTAHLDLESESEVESDSENIIIRSASDLEEIEEDSDIEEESDSEDYSDSENDYEPPQIRKRGNININADDSSKHDKDKDFPKPY